jgi:hypothetical protein
MNNYPLHNINEGYISITKYKWQWKYDRSLEIFYIPRDIGR